MNKDKALEELFLTHKPHFDDSDVFMASLTKRLDAVEFIKQHQEATIRRYKMAMFVAFIAGIISGAFAMVYVLSAPMSAPLITINSQIAVLQWLGEHSRFITVTVISLFLTFGVTALISNIQEIKSMRKPLAC